MTVCGHDEGVVIAADEFRRLKGERTGKSLIVAIHALPHCGLDIEPARELSPLRNAFHR